MPLSGWELGYPATRCKYMKYIPPKQIAFSKQSWSKFKQYENLDYVIYYREGNAVKIDREVINTGFEMYATLIEKIF